jgi:hypothetical protein
LFINYVYSMTTTKIASRTRSARTLHLCDIENICGGITPDVTYVTSVSAEYRELVCGPDDLFVVACSPTRAAVCLFGWGCSAQWLFRAGLDGADTALLDAYTPDEIAIRYDRVVLGSGDGIFAPFAAELGRLGVHVTVVAREGTLSRALAMAAAAIRMLPAVPDHEGGQCHAA